MSRDTPRFSSLQQGLHWLMAIMVIAMLFIGIGMVSTLSPRYPALVALHRPLGIFILALVLVRLGVRWIRGTPPLPADLPKLQVFAAKFSHLLLYTLMLVTPLVGWGMLSAGGYPIVMFGAIHLPPILPHDNLLHAELRAAHTCLAYIFLATILLHLAAALMHALIRRDGVFSSMLPHSRKEPATPPPAQ